MSRILVRRPVALAVSTLLLGLPVAGSAAEAPGGESPQAVVARLNAAAEKQDMRELIACMKPDARREMALMMVAGAGMMVAFMSMGGAMGAEMAEGMAEGVSGEELPAEEKAKLDEGRREVEAKAAEMQKRYEAILERHGVTAMMEDDSPLPEDPAARTAALDRMFAKTDEMALLDELFGLMQELGEGDSSKTPVELPGPITDYEIDGDRATAKAGDETIEFVRVDGRWYIELPEKPAAAEPEATN